MTTAITIGMIIIYVAIMMGIGVYTSRQARSVNDFVLGGRNVGSWLTAFAYGTSYFSAVVFIGYAGQFGWNYGVSATWVGIGNALLGSLLAWIVLGKRTRIMTQSLGAKTMPEYFERRWNSKGLKIAAALIVFIFLIPYTASVYNGLSRLFNMAFHIDSEAAYQIIIIVMALLTAIYVILGGYSATAINDFIQGIVMLIGIAAVVICTVQNRGGFTEALSSLGQIEVNGKTNTLNSVFGPDPLNLLGVVILIVAGGSYFLGGFDRLFCTTAEANEAGKAVIPALSNGKLDFDAMIPTLLQTALPDLLIGLVVVLVLSASMSTLSSLVLTSCSTLTIDLIRPNMKKCSEKKEIIIMRCLIAVFLIISVLIAFNKNASISTLMSYSWGALAGAFLGPFLYGLFSKKVTKTAVGTSFVLGIGLTLGHMLLFGFGWFPSLSASAASLPLNLASPINAGAITMILSLIVVPLVSACTKVSEPEYVENIFTCYTPEEKAPAKEQ